MRKYKFYGWEHADVPARNECYRGIKTPKDLYDALSEIWCAKTCAPRMRDAWTLENKTLGQCSITAFLAQDIFGGKVYGIRRPGGNYHCYNVVSGCCFDLTSEQFGGEALVYENNPQQYREVHFEKEEKRLRYEYLKKELEKWGKKMERFEFRSIRKDEAEQAIAIEQECFPPHEACSPKAMKERIAVAPDLFLVAIDRMTGNIAGFLNGISTSEDSFRDEFFTDIRLYEPEGKNVMLLGLDVLTKYRGQGLAREIVHQYRMREQENGRSMLILTCLQEKVEMYLKFGFIDRGIANSTWGNEKWHEMALEMERE